MRSPSRQGRSGRRARGAGVTGAGGAQVINLDSQARVSYRLEADLINNQVALVSDEQQALANIFAQCAPASLNRMASSAVSRLS